MTGTRRQEDRTVRQKVNRTNDKRQTDRQTDRTVRQKVGKANDRRKADRDGRTVDIQV